ncbi:Cof-type HAD-IIB family hydrolase [Psychromonas ossibalaenae]|uniref:Cof-type HAD-IIB family hydrolase n=1 Tax=Psychromonas ossibalaenae TaxID=444922 RepID=UPI000382972B|nr:Cof-type HAD-IIB family hydrolase [Psychromonas ossibalaenae]
MYKLVALDMDGTLLNSEKALTSRVREAIKSAKEQGIKVVLASGRPFEGMLPTLKELDLDGADDYVLTYNASLILKVACKSVVSSAILTGQDAIDLNKLADKLGVNILAYSMTRGLITPKQNEYTDYEAKLNGIEYSEFDFNMLDADEDILKVMMIDQEQTLSKAVEQLPKSLQEKYSMARSTPFFYEFMNKNSNKGMGMAALTAHLGLTAEQIICVGDAANDLEMIKYAGLGVAMENGSDEVKANADYITASNDQDGVAHVFEKYVLN